MRAEVDEVWVIEKCSVTGARPVHLVVQLLYGLLWEDCTALFMHGKSRRQRVAAVIWNVVLSDSLPPQLSMAKGREQWERGSKIWVGVRDQCTFLPWHARFPIASVSWTIVFPLQMTIKRWWEFSNKINTNVNSCLGCAWQLHVFWFSVRLPFASCRDRGTGCDCHALRATDHLSLLNLRLHHCTRLAGFLICHAVLHKCAIIKKSNRTCRGF